MNTARIIREKLMIVWSRKTRFIFSLKQNTGA
jgi:hypothetical protein